MFVVLDLIKYSYYLAFTCKVQLVRCCTNIFLELFLLILSLPGGAPNWVLSSTDKDLYHSSFYQYQCREKYIANGSKRRARANFHLKMERTVMLMRFRLNRPLNASNGVWRSPKSSNHSKGTARSRQRNKKG